MTAPEPGAQIHMVIWEPVRHPMTGRTQPVLRNYTDRIITYAERDELEAQFMLPCAPGSMKMERGSEVVRGKPNLS